MAKQVKLEILNIYEIPLQEDLIICTNNISRQMKNVCIVLFMVEEEFKKKKTFSTHHKTFGHVLLASDFKRIIIEPQKNISFL